PLADGEPGGRGSCRQFARTALASFALVHPVATASAAGHPRIPGPTGKKVLMSVESTEALERSVLEGKDREQLLAIAAALGVKATSRAKKADIIAKILEQTGGPSAAESPAPARAPRARNANGNGRADETVAVPAPTTET